MATEREPKKRVRGFVGDRLQALMDQHGIRQEDLATAVSDRGLGDWTQPTVARFIAGSRSLTLEEVVILCAVLGEPLTEFLPGDDPCTLNNQPVTVAQVRDVLEHGTVRAGHSTGGALEVEPSRGTRTLSERIAQQLGTTPARSTPSPGGYGAAWFQRTRSSR